MDENKFIEFFAKAFKEVILPVFEDMHLDIKVLKEDVAVLKEDMSDVKDTLGRMERRTTLEAGVWTKMPVCPLEA